MVERIAMVSIIIPVYNTKEYLPRCLDSIVQQTYEDWELILVDDESTDGSDQICDQYAQKDERIQVIHQKNAGPSASRQNGILRASGEWIMFSDSDDWIDSEMLEMLLEHQKISQAKMICSFFVDINENGKMHHLPLPSEEIIDCFSAEDCVRHMHETRYMIGSPCAKLFHKSLFEGIQFCNEVTIGEDYSMIVELMQKAKRVRIVKKEYYYRFVRKGSISHMGYSERHKKAFDNYMRVRLELIQKYPALSEAIIGFHTEYEMAVLTAMCRNKNFDWETIHKLKADLKTNMKSTWKNPKIALYMKVCAWMIAYPTWLFIVLFRILYLCTGR